MSNSSIKSASDAVKGLNLENKVFLVTGAYSGLGAATTKALLNAGAKVIIAGRNENSQKKFALELIHSTVIKFNESNLDYSTTVDLESLASVEKFAKHIHNSYDKIDCIISNAGVMKTPYGKTKDGFEIQMGVNVIGHFLLNKILAPKTSRQVWLSSTGHCLVGQWPGKHDLVNAPRINIEDITKVDEATYDGWYRYQQSKLGDILLARQFAAEYPHLQTCAVHPGIVSTKLSRHMSIWPIVKYLFRLIVGKAEKPVNADAGARTQTLCAVMPAEKIVNGAYYSDCEVTKEAEAARNAGDAKKLYDYCNEVTKAFQ